MPFYSMVQDWVSQGQLSDPFDEFFVIEGGEDAWRSKYSICADMIPSFISSSLAKKIFLIGKSINFIRHSCEEPGYTQKQSNIEYSDAVKLSASIDRVYKLHTSHLYDQLINKYELMQHFRGIKRYLLLAQGDFVQCLMEQLG